MNIPYVFKKCSKCGEWLVASTVNFYKAKSGKYGLRGSCKKCHAKYKKQYYEDNKEKILEYNKQYYKDNKEYYKEYREDNKEYYKEYREDNKEYYKEYNKEYYKDNKEYYKEYNKEYKKQYYEDNKEYKKQYYEDNKEKISEHNKQYYKNNKEKISEKRKQYNSTPQGQIVLFNSNVRRRIKEDTQGNGINKDQWLECMKFFNWKCAYSGKSLNNKNRTIDHIEPLNKGGEHNIWNLVPMDKSYNSSKHDKDMLEWYKEQEFYSEERLQKIYEWQKYSYEKWGNDLKAENN